MVTFSNPFLSVAGQVERLKNVGETLAAAVTLKGVTADTGNKALDKVISTAASNPYATAAVITAAASPIGAAVAKSVGQSFASSSLTTKAAVITGGIVGGSFLTTSEKAQQDLTNLPSSLSNFGSNLGQFYDNPSLKSAADIVKENPLISAATAAGIIGTVGVGAAGLIASAANTAALRSKTSASMTPQGAVAVGNDTSTIRNTPEAGTIATASSLNPVSDAVTPITTTRAVSTKRRKSVSKPQNLNIRLYNYNQNGNNYRHF